jgi:hypothetical protein
LNLSGELKTAEKETVMKQPAAADKKMFLERALKAADWFVNSQLGKVRPKWSADRGRYLYYHFMPSKKYVPGINWTQGRGISVTAEAYRVTGRERYRESAELAAAYLAAMQPLDPRFPKTLGAIREYTPVDPTGGALDGAQAASSLLILGKAARRPEWIHRGKAFCDYLLRNFSPSKGLVCFAFYDKADRERVVYNKDEGNDCIANATVIPFWFLYRLTGEKKYLRPLLWSADRMLEYQQPDGCFHGRKPGDGRPLPKMNQHDGVGKGRGRLRLFNDDGMMVVPLAAYRVTGNRKYLDAMVRYLEWIVRTGPVVRPYCSFPAQASAALSIGKEAGIDVLDWIMAHLEDRVLKLQVRGSGDPDAEGGFRGEDEEGDAGIFGGKGLDYVTTRVTCYAADLLFRLSGQGKGGIFSVDGI